jgi:3-hydroxyacyl-CoA dehydrogenase/enoyl-CoA hydratase/3-hydroxybutyryl-CoA epimerase
MRSLTLQTDADGIALIVWDMPGRAVNVLSAESVDDFGRAVERVVADGAIRGAVVTSAKSAFIAGTDPDWLAQLMRDGGDAPGRARGIYDALMRLQLLLRRIETGGKPFAAAINGSALGAGFALCLACHHRLAADDPALHLGLPEAKFGLLPGGGGTQRLLRMLGQLRALPLLLEGRALSPGEALHLGLVDGIVPPDELVAAAKAWVRGAADPAKPWDRPGFVLPGGDPRSLAAANALSVANAQLHKNSRGKSPQLDAIQQLVHDGALVPMDTALRLEAKALTRLMLHAVA